MFQFPTLLLNLLRADFTFMRSFDTPDMAQIVRTVTCTTQHAGALSAVHGPVLYNCQFRVSSASYSYQQTLERRQLCLDGFVTLIRRL